MTEWHDDGLTKQERYAMEMRRVNSDYDAKQTNRSFLTSKRGIEYDRQQALRKLDVDFHGPRASGFFSE